MKKRATKKVMKTKGTKRAAKKSRSQSDLSPRAVRGGAVKGGASDMFIKLGHGIKGATEERNSGSIMKF